MMRFSERYGYKPVKDIIQTRGMDGELRNGLWNVVHELVIKIISKYISLSTMETSANSEERVIAQIPKRLWINFFKRPVDTLSNQCIKTTVEIRSWYFKADWDQVYDFIEFIEENIPSSRQALFAEICNAVLERELSGYRLIGSQITPITNEEEVQSIEGTLSNNSLCKGARAHLKSALEMLSDRKNPDYRNSIKESVSAVEAIAQIITKDDTASLGDALKAIIHKGTLDMHGALSKGYECIYGYTSDEGGIRHAMLDEPNVDFEDACYMLVSCSAFINYLATKASKVGINLK